MTEAQNTLQQQIKEALEIGLDAAEEVALETHQKYAGHKAQLHAAVDEDVRKIKEAIAALSAAQAEQAQPAAMQSKYQLELPAGLAPDTKNLVVRFAKAMAEKLYKAEIKYGYSNGWMHADWMDECRQKLIEHIGKGDPRDVANYCAFLWYHKESTAPAQPLSDDKLDAELKQLRSELAYERSHREQLQRALMFWLPMVPNDPPEITKRVGDDAMLLMFYEGKDEPSAQDLGWISLDATRRYKYLRERDLDTITKGGVFAGQTPDNLVLNGEDLDATIDAATADQAKEKN